MGEQHLHSNPLTGAEHRKLWEKIAALEVERDQVIKQAGDLAEAARIVKLRREKWAPGVGTTTAEGEGVLPFPLATALTDLNDALANFRESEGKRGEGETVCDRCGGPNLGSWHAPSPLWNAVVRNPETDLDKWGIICPQCFAELAEERFGELVWCIKPHDLDVASLWSREGYEWDAETCLWREAAA